MNGFKQNGKALCYHKDFSTKDKEDVETEHHNTSGENTSSLEIKVDMHKLASTYSIITVIVCQKT